MKGTTLTFAQNVETSKDSMNNPVYEVVNIEVANCLIAPIIEPSSAREQQSMEQSRDQVRVHIPKAHTGDLSNSAITYNGKVFTLDSDSVVFMNENTPTPWNRYFRAESING